MTSQNQTNEPAEVAEKATEGASIPVLLPLHKGAEDSHGWPWGDWSRFPFGRTRGRKRHVMALGLSDLAP